MIWGHLILYHQGNLYHIPLCIGGTGGPHTIEGAGRGRAGVKGTGVTLTTLYHICSILLLHILSTQIGAGDIITEYGGMAGKNKDIGKRGSFVVVHPLF